MPYVVRIVIKHNNGQWKEDKHYFPNYDDAYSYMTKLANHMYKKMIAKEIETYNVSIQPYHGV